MDQNSRTSKFDDVEDQDLLTYLPPVINENNVKFLVKVFMPGGGKKPGHTTVWKNYLQ